MFIILFKLILFVGLCVFPSPPGGNQLNVSLGDGSSFNVNLNVGGEGMLLLSMMFKREHINSC